MKGRYSSEIRRNHRQVSTCFEAETLPLRQRSVHPPGSPHLVQFLFEQRSTKTHTLRSLHHSQSVQLDPHTVSEKYFISTKKRSSPLINHNAQLAQKQPRIYDSTAKRAQNFLQSVIFFRKLLLALSHASSHSQS